MSEEIKFCGIPVYFNGREYIVPPLSMRQFGENFALLTERVAEDASAENVAERTRKFIHVIGIALRRNYPEITDEELLDVLDVKTFPEALAAVQLQSGNAKTIVH